MNILFYRYNNICEPDIIEAFKILGYYVDTIELEMTDKNPDGKLILDTVISAAMKKSYDGIFSVNFYPVLARICNALRIRYISWTTDCPVDELFSEEIKSGYNRTFCFDYNQYERARLGNPDRVFYMPLATNVNRWDSIIAKNDSRKWKSDISFVGSLYTEKIGQDWFEESAKSRLEVINTLGSRFELSVYTGSNTDLLPVKNYGRVKTHTEMPLVFCNSKINLNITCASIKTGLPQRIWDVLGCRGFLITNQQSEIEEYFTVGKDLETYSSMDELVEKVDFYLRNDDLRKRIAQNGYEKVKKEHTFVHRLADIMFISYNVG